MPTSSCESCALQGKKLDFSDVDGLGMAKLSYSVNQDIISR